MRVLVQRVRHGQVEVAGKVTGRIERGFVVLTGIGAHDGDAELDWMAAKIAGLRVFPDDDGKMNRSLVDVGGSALVVSQFTLYGDCHKGRRPSFVAAAPPEVAAPLVEAFVERLRVAGVERVETGVFGASMQVELVNDGPVTLWIEREPRSNRDDTVWERS